MAELDNGYSRVANELLEEAAKRKFNSTQSSIIFFVLRHTYGFQRKAHEMSVGCIAEGIGANPIQIKRELKRLIDFNVIRVFQEATPIKPRQIGMNKNCEEWSVPMYRVPDSTQDTNQYPGNEIVPPEDTNKFPLGDTNQFPKERYSFKDNFKDSIYTVFEHWNSKRIIVHRELTQATMSVVNARLKTYSPETLMEAIDNYHICLMDDAYFFSYKWTLKDFMNPKNLDRFMTDNDPFTNFKKKGNRERAPTHDQISQWANELEEEQRGRQTNR